MRVPFPFGPAATTSTKPKPDSSGRLYFVESYWIIGLMKCFIGLLFCLPFYYMRGFPGHPSWFLFIVPLWGLTGPWDLGRLRRFTFDPQRGMLVIRSTYLARIHRTTEIPLRDISLAVEPGVSPVYGTTHFVRLIGPSLKIALGDFKEINQAQDAAAEYARVLRIDRAPSAGDAQQPA